jgi:cysteine desulfurase/selenocysteine lyase
MNGEVINNVLDIDKIRNDFPILKSKVNGKPLVYLDNAASTQKPVQVIDSIRKYYESSNRNIHRGVYQLSQKATEEYENSRSYIRTFLNAEFDEEIIFTSGATESINLIAQSFSEKFIKEGDEIIITEMEHHANIVPWQVIRDKYGAKLKIVPINDNGEIIFEEFEALLSEKTKIVSVVHISNTIGTINPVKEIIEKAHNFGAKVLIDGSQSAQHIPVDVQELDCDFYVFSGHKVYGPTGICVLYGKKELLDQMPPYKTGGDMIKSVSFEKTEYAELPNKFEAGTPNISGAVGLRNALEYISAIGLNNIANHEQELLEYATNLLIDNDELHQLQKKFHLTLILRCL